ncbi:pyridoxal 5'-phosphate synthase glutaminase subunit PdxT [Desulfomicrobium escambiense]|uniref:pyridoxal 5'-phosphate synthase glutaminase subunit PdxT n=1 Tax=Desulfomicrobium escambiense TaxID=29503 RepID=UPI0004913ADB|nr:pyridoxal 5'-phosphate synthase glutaminase subunit PdxT [Desulfomicrobium escambiense]
MRIGVMALQGAFAEHREMLSSLGVRAELVRTPGGLDGLDGLILPGGESTSMRRLAAWGGLDAVLREFGASRPVWGVCAGLILMARRVEGEEPFAGLMDMAVARNAYGRQGESFVADVQPGRLGGAPFPGVFIRAPHVVEAGPDVEVLARLDGLPVALVQGRLLATAFHPELTRDPRMHAFFLKLCAAGGALP